MVDKVQLLCIFQVDGSKVHIRFLVKFLKEQIDTNDLLTVIKTLLYNSLKKCRIKSMWDEGQDL